MIIPFTEFADISLLPTALPVIIVPLTEFAAISELPILFAAISTDVI